MATIGFFTAAVMAKLLFDPVEFDAALNNILLFLILMHCFRNSLALERKGE